MTETPRPGDQPLPTPGVGPGMHDLLIASLHDRDTPVADRIADDLAARRDLGLARYGQLLQVGNGRDALRDLYEELLDAMACGRLLTELMRSVSGSVRADIDEVVRHVDHAVSHARSALDARGAVTA